MSETKRQKERFIDRQANRNVGNWASEGGKRRMRRERKRAEILRVCLNFICKVTICFGRTRKKKSTLVAKRYCQICLSDENIISDASFFTSLMSSSSSPSLSSLSSASSSSSSALSLSSSSSSPSSPSILPSETNYASARAHTGLQVQPDVYA